MRRAVYRALIAATLWALPALAAQADTFTINFCPGDKTCPTGVTDASLTFTQITDPLDANYQAGDANVYYATISITGDSTAPAYVDEVSFSIDGLQTPSGYETLPQLIAAPSTGTPWVAFFDNLNGSAGSCDTNVANSQEVCGGSGPGDPTNYGGILPDQTLTWTFLVDLSGSTLLSTASSVNLRAQFLDTDGGNAGILSPNGGTPTRVPEPATVVLLGSGAGFLAYFGQRTKRRWPVS